MPSTPSTSPNITQIVLSPEQSSQLINPSLSPHQLTNVVPVKLSKDNYLTWKSLLIPILQTYGMLGLIEGTDVCPPPTLPNSSTVNPDYEEWVKKDRTCRIWLNATLSEALLPYTVGATTAHTLWLNLQRRFSAITRSHVLQLKSRLQNLQKGSNTMTQYLQMIKEIADGLAAAGAPLDETDLIAHTLHGLPPEYDAFTTTVRIRAQPMATEELHGFLLSEEIEINNRLELSNTLATNPNPEAQFQAMMANSQRSNRPTTLTSLYPAPHFPASPRSNHPRSTSRTHNNLTPRPAFNRSQTPLLPNPHTRPQRPSNRPSRPRCQICNLEGHIALRCFNRYNHAYQGHIPPSRIAANIVTGVGSSAHNPHSTWLLDTGATNHITNDLSNLSVHADYPGPETVVVGNGAQLPIQHTGSSTATSAQSGFYVGESSGSQPL